MDDSSKANSKPNGSKNSGPLVDILGMSSDSLLKNTISPNAVRSRIGANSNSNAQHTDNTSFFTSSHSRIAVPGSVQRSVSPVSLKNASSPPNVVERHMVRRRYEEQSTSVRQTAVGSRLAADTSPDGSTVGDAAPDNFDSLSLQLSPQLNRRPLSSTVPSTPVRLSTVSQPHNLQPPDVRQGELSDSVLQMQAELKRTLESSSSAFTSLVDLSNPVGKKWKRAMSLPQNDFSRVMCHRAVAKSLAQNIRSALRSSPSTIKETLAPGELQAPAHEVVFQAPVHEAVLQEQKPPPQHPVVTQTDSNKLIEISPPHSPAINEVQEINNCNNDNSEDIWVLRDNHVDRLDDVDRQWKAQQIVEEQNERRLQSETAKRMADYVKNRQQEIGTTEEFGHTSSVITTRRSSDSSNSSNDPKKNHQNTNNSVSMDSVSASNRSYVTGAGAVVDSASYSRLRNEASGHYHHQTANSRGSYNQMNMAGDDFSDYSDREEDFESNPGPQQQPSLLRPFSNLLAGRKGAYSKVPMLNERQPSPRNYSSSSSASAQYSSHPQQQYSQSYRPENIHQQSDRRSSFTRAANASNSGEQLDYCQDEVPPVHRNPEDFDTDEETDKLLEKSYQDQRQLHVPELAEHALSDRQTKPAMKEVRLADPEHPSVLLEGVLFRCRYLGSTQLVSDSQPTRAVRMMQAQEAVSRIKAPFGEAQPSSEVDLFISFEKIMVLSTNLQDIIMDHALKTISYVADLDDVVVLMARRRQLPESNPTGLSNSASRSPQLKMLCHVFESEDAHHISDAIGEAFHLAYLAFLRANGIEDPSALPQIDNNGEENIGPQDIFNDDLPRFVDKNHQKDVVVSKTRGEALGIVVVESGWGSVIPTVVVANMLPTGPAARSGQLNIGDQLLSVNGISLVGLPMTSCQSYIKAAKNQTAVRITLIRCPPVTEVLIKRPDIKYQLGFSVHNGIICSLLRGGIAERGGVRVGHRIIEINGESVVAVSHEKIVNLLSSSVGEIRMKTMPMSIFRLLTGQDTPNYI